LLLCGGVLDKTTPSTRYSIMDIFVDRCHAAIKLLNILYGFTRQKQFVAVHSISNKLTGAMLFAIPLTLPLIELQYSATFVCLFATFAALEEGHIIRTKKTIKKWKDYPRYHHY